MSSAIPSSRDPRSAGRHAALIGVLALALIGCGVTGNATSRISPAATPSGSHRPVPDDFPLLGAWTTTITRDDLQAGGITDPRLLDENSGIFTWAFEADGTWRQVQVSLDDSPVMNPVFSGFYTAEAGVVVATTEFPEVYRDAGIRYRFAVRDGAATFDLLDPPDAVLPIIVEAHPWERAQP